MNEFDHTINTTLNFAGVVSPYSDFNFASVVILPVPYDGTSEWHKGSRFAPKAIIEASDYLEYYDAELNKETYQVGIHTLPFIQPDFTSPEKTVETITAAAGEILTASKFLISLGGEHTISLGAIKAYKERYADFCVIQLDAHPDLRDEYNGKKICQATVMRRICEICPVIQVGIRSLSKEEHKFIEQKKIPIFYCAANALDISEIQRHISSFSKNIYLTIDMDVFDPSIMPAVGTPEPGGLLWNDVLDTIRILSSKNNIIGMDLVELCPQEGPAACAYMAAKLIYKTIGYCINSRGSLK